MSFSSPFFFSSRRRHTRWPRDWSSDVCSSDLVLRRTNTLPPLLRGPTAERYRFGEWTFNAAQREIAGPEGIALPLSSGEFKLLMAFLERPKVALSREQLLDLTKGRDAEVFDRSVDNQVSRLRRKIEQDPKNPRYIKTVWGGGYMFTSDVEIL